ncbi:MAG: hypothetical protein Kow0032_28700 [Methyloligellaceae bacterium]
MRCRWHRGGSGRTYAMRKASGRTVYLHRLIMNAEPGDMVDHVNGDPLDCRRSNLRIVTASQNAANRAHTRARSGFRNVEERPSGRFRFRAAVVWQGQRYRTVYVETAEEAARHADMMARLLYGSHASFNFPWPGERHCRPMRGQADG